MRGNGSPSWPCNKDLVRNVKRSYMKICGRPGAKNYTARQEPPDNAGQEELQRWEETHGRRHHEIDFMLKVSSE